MKKTDYSIEYSHIYTTQTFGVEQRQSLELMKSKERELTKSGLSVQRHVLIDDYSTVTGLQRFDEDTFKNELEDNNALPDTIVLESDLVEACNELATKIQDKSLRKSLNHYYETRRKWPCSMCVAAWYLVRLGDLKSEVTLLTSDKIISVLPDRFRTPELEAKAIISATEFKDSINDIEVIFFESDFSGHSDWQDFDAEEYVARNYLQQVLPEDKTIISFVASYLQSHCKVGSLQNLADIGAGPNLYPTLIIEPFCSPEGTIRLVDPVKNNRDFLSRTIKSPNAWAGFENLLHDENVTLYQNAPKLYRNIVIENGDIFALPEDEYDLVTSFFVSESITDNKEEVIKAMESLEKSVKPGGILITAHMLGSVGYFAGMLTSFPATPITKEDLESFYSDFTDVEICTTSHNPDYDPRKGYKGMAVVCGKKPVIS